MKLTCNDEKEDQLRSPLDDYGLEMKGKDEKRDEYRLSSLDVSSNKELMALNWHIIIMVRHSVVLKRRNTFDGVI